MEPAKIMEFIDGLPHPVIDLCLKKLICAECSKINTPKRVYK